MSIAGVLSALQWYFKRHLSDRSCTFLHGDIWQTVDTDRFIACFTDCSDLNRLGFSWDDIVQCSATKLRVMLICYQIAVNTACLLRMTIDYLRILPVDPYQYYKYFWNLFPLDVESFSVDIFLEDTHGMGCFYCDLNSSNGVESDINWIRTRKTGLITASTIMYCESLDEYQYLTANWIPYWWSNSLLLIHWITCFITNLSRPFLWPSRLIWFCIQMDGTMTSHRGCHWNVCLCWAFPFTISFSSFFSGWNPARRQVHLISFDRPVLWSIR